MSYEVTHLSVSFDLESVKLIKKAWNAFKCSIRMNLSRSQEKR